MNIGALTAIMCANMTIQEKASVIKKKRKKSKEKSKLLFNQHSIKKNKRSDSNE